MPLYVAWQDVALRLLLTVIAGGIIGSNRGVHGHAAGLRTTILVTLAASVAMITANLLLSTTGKNPESFVQMDVMRMALGILTGVGFIGGGAIFKKDSMVSGVTTAATLWTVTVIGLAIGSGLLALGIAATAIAGATLWLLKAVENKTIREHKAILIVCPKREDTPSDIGHMLRDSQYKASFRKLDRSEVGKPETLVYQISWQETDFSQEPLSLLRLLEPFYIVESLELLTESGY